VNGDRDKERNIIHRSLQIGKEQNRLALMVSLIPKKFWNALASIFASNNTLSKSIDKLLYIESKAP
jgi:hypothetical protein